MRILVLILFSVFFVYSIFDLFTDVKKGFNKESDKFSGFYRLEDVIDFPLGEKSAYIKIMKEYKVYNVSFSSNADTRSSKKYLINQNIQFLEKNLKMKIKKFNIKNQQLYLSIYFYNASSSHILKEKQVPIQCSFLNQEGIVLDILNFDLPLVLKPKEVILVNDINVTLSNKILDYLKNNKKVRIECDLGY